MKTKKELIKDWNKLKYKKNLSGDEALKAVKQDGYNLKYIADNNQTLELCLAAVKEDGYALKFVRNQTSEICLAAINQNSNALQHVDKSIIEQWRKEIDNEKTIMIDGKPVSESTIKLALQKYFS